MKKQKSGIRAVKKEQRETAKALAKEAEKLTKALDKAEKKRMREEEKQRIKAEAKIERERLKAEKKLITDTTPPSDIAAYESDPLEEPCTSISKDLKECTQLASTVLLGSGTQSPSTKAPEPNNRPQSESTGLTEETISLSQKDTGPYDTKPNAVLSEAARAVLEPAHVVRPSNSIVYEEEIATPTCTIPMEG
jgi:hypothetical protein